MQKKKKGKYSESQEVKFFLLIWISAMSKSTLDILGGFFKAREEKQAF